MEETLQDPILSSLVMDVWMQWCMVCQYHAHCPLLNVAFATNEMQAGWQDDTQGGFVCNYFERTTTESIVT